MLTPTKAAALTVKSWRGRFCLPVLCGKLYSRQRAGMLPALRMFASVRTTNKVFSLSREEGMKKFPLVRLGVLLSGVNVAPNMEGAEVTILANGRTVAFAHYKSSGMLDLSIMNGTFRFCESLSQAVADTERFLEEFFRDVVSPEALELIDSVFGEDAEGPKV